MIKKQPVAATAPVRSIAPVDITDPMFKANPFPFYAQLRAEAPVFPVKGPSRQRAWLVTRYDDVLYVLKEEHFVKDRRNALSPEQLKKEELENGRLLGAPEVVSSEIVFK